MKNLVIDANIAVKWFFPENYADHALRILKGNREFIAPDYIWVEVANVFRKKVRQKEILDQQSQEMLSEFLRIPIQTFPSKPMILKAVSLAGQLSISVYDALYLALAISHETAVVTADRKMFDAINKEDLNSHVVWIEDVK